MNLKKLINKELLLISSLISIIWIILLIFSGSATSGYHYEDDHELLDLSKKLENNNFFTVFDSLVKKEINQEHRFRFIYFFHRLLEVQVFGTNLFLISIYILILALSSSFLFYLFARNIGFNILESLLFSVFALIGEQAAIWWRLGPNETIGIFLLSLSLFLISKSLKQKSYKKYMIQFFYVLSLILFALTKENFILTLPALIFLIIYLEIKVNKIRIKDAVLTVLPVILILSVFFTAILTFIIFKIGLSWNGRGLTGVFITKYLFRFIDLSRYNFYGIILFCLTLFLSKLIVMNKNYKLILESLSIFCFLGLFILPQLIIFSNGIYERYLNPSTIAYSFAIISFFSIVRNNLDISLKKIKPIIIIFSILIFLSILFFFFFSFNNDFKNFLLHIGTIIKKKEIHESWFVKFQLFLIKFMILQLSIVGILLILKIFSRNKNIPISYVLYVVLFAVLSFNIYDTFCLTKDFAENGKNTTKFLNKIINESDKNSIIVIAVEPSDNYESGYSIKSYLNNVGQRSNLFIYPISTYSNNEIETIYGRNWYANNYFENIKDKSEIDFFVLLLSYPPFEDIEPLFLKRSKPWFNESSFSRYKIGNNILFVKKY